MPNSEPVLHRGSSIAAAVPIPVARDRGGGTGRLHQRPVRRAVAVAASAAMPMATARTQLDPPCAMGPIVVAY